MKVKDKHMMTNDIPNKAEIPILNHRDDGEMREIRKDNDTFKFFSFKTFYELAIKHHARNCDVAIAEDFFWTAMPIMVDGELMIADKDIVSTCVMASVWGTPCIIIGDKAYACYETAPRNEFPGVYLKDWPQEFLDNELKKASDFMIEITEELTEKYEDLKRF